MNNLGNYLPIWTYNISTESLFHVASTYAITILIICGENVLKSF